MTPEDRLGTRIADLLREDVSPDIATRLAFARQQAVSRVPRPVPVPSAVGSMQLALGRSSLRIWALATFTVVGALALGWGFQPGHADASWEAELQYHATADNHVE